MPDDDLSKLIDDMSPEEKLLVLEYFTGNREEFLFAAAEAKARYERADGYRSDQPDDLRQRYAMAANLAQEEWRGDELLCERIADYVLAVRDPELRVARDLLAALDRIRSIPRLPHFSEQDGELGRAYTRGWESVIASIDAELTSAREILGTPGPTS